MKVALAAAEYRDRDVAFNLAQIRRWMERAAERGAELICFGEAFLQGFDSLDWRLDADCRMARSVEAAELGQLRRWTSELGIDLMLGFIERDGDALYYSCALLSDGRMLHTYRRISRGWKEPSRTDGHYREGDSAEPFFYRGRRCRIALCGDLWDYPERFFREAEVLFWPVYVDYPPEEWNREARTAYAAQAARTGVRTLFVNSISDAGGHGGCCVFEGGSVLAELPMDREGLLVAEI